MRDWIVRGRVVALMAASLAAAAGSGALVAVAVSASSAPAPQKTVTVNVTNGATGPTGPPGPSGVVDCPGGFVPGEVVINHPGGHVTIYGCIQ